MPLVLRSVSGAIVRQGVFFYLSLPRVASAKIGALQLSWTWANAKVAPFILGAIRRDGIREIEPYPAY